MSNNISNVVKKNPAGSEEVIDIILDRNKWPIAWQAKKDELMNEAGMSEKDAENFIVTTPIQMELYYNYGFGLYLVETEAVEACVPMFDPYNGNEMVEDDG